MNTAKKLSIRLEAVGGDKVRQEFKNIGSDGQKAFQRITQVITPANDNLKVLDNTAKAFNNTLKQAASLAGEKSFMNDTLEKTSVDIKAQERERMSQVLSAENVKGKEATAQALLAKTDLSASDILAILETVPVAKQTNALDVAMAQIKNPAITPSAEDKEETPEDVANRIASYTIGG